MGSGDSNGVSMGTLESKKMEAQMDYAAFQALEDEIKQKSDELKELREQRKEFMDKIEDILADQDSFKFGNNEFTFQEKKRQTWNKKACMEAAQDGMLDVDSYAEGGEFKRTLKRKRLKE